MTGEDSRLAAGEQDYAGTPRPDAIVPALDAVQLAALQEVGREWGRVTDDPRAWREALPVDPALGEYPTASEFRPARFTRVGYHLRKVYQKLGITSCTKLTRMMLTTS